MLKQEQKNLTKNPPPDGHVPNFVTGPPGHTSLPPVQNMATAAFAGVIKSLLEIVRDARALVHARPDR